MANEEPVGQPPRGRTRDYTIPVRLNQINLPPHSRRPEMMQQLVTLLSAKQIISYLLVLIVIIASTKVQQSHCDPQQQSSTNKEAPFATGNSNKLAAGLKQSSGKTAPMKSLGAAKTSGAAIDNKRHREKLLAKLSENIERQHLRMAAMSGLERPSKFDSGEDTSHELLRSGSSSSSKKSDEDVLRDILRMHEQPIRQLHYSSPDALANEESPTLASQPLIKSSSKMLPNKVVAHLISYIVSPFAGKLADVPLAGNFSLPLLSPFTGRSSTQSPLLQQAAAPAAQESRKHFLALPSWMKSNRKSAYSTKPSTMFGDASSGWTMSSSSSDYTKDDLVADPSSLQQLKAPAATSFVAPYARPLSSRQNRGNRDPSFPLDDAKGNNKPREYFRPTPLVGRWLKNSANHMAQNYLQDSFRGLLTLSQLPILPVGPVSTAPSILEPRPVQQRRRGSGSSSSSSTSNKNQSDNNDQTAIGSPGGGESSSSATGHRKATSDRRAKALEEMYRYAYILGTSMVGRKRDPLKALSTKTRPAKQTNGQIFTPRSISQLAADNRRQMLNLAKALQRALFPSSISSSGAKQQAANPRGVMWDMATDPTLVVTLMHLIERASVALPLGFLLMPVVQMMRTNPLSGFNLGQVLPPRALHRSVEHELLAKRLDAVDKVLNRALRSSHRESSLG